MLLVLLLLNRALKCCLASNGISYTAQTHLLLNACVRRAHHSGSVATSKLHARLPHDFITTACTIAHRSNACVAVRSVGRTVRADCVQLVGVNTWSEHTHSTHTAGTSSRTVSAHTRIAYIIKHKPSNRTPSQPIRVAQRTVISCFASFIIAHTNQPQFTSHTQTHTWQ